MAAWTTLTPTQSQDSSCGTTASLSPADSHESKSRVRRSPNFRSAKKQSSPFKGKASSSHKQKESTVMGVLRVVVLATFLVYQLLCVMQSQHLVIHDDGLTKTHMADHTGLHPATHRGEWKVPSFSRRTSDAALLENVPVGTYDENAFKYKLNQWRQQSNRLLSHPNLQRLRQRQQQQLMHGSPTSRLLQPDNSTKPRDRVQLYIPFWDQQALYRKRHSWHLMTVVLSDDCLHNYRKEKRTMQYPTLVTLKDAVKSQHSDVVVYFAQTPTSTIFAQASQSKRKEQETCQAKLVAIIQQEYASQLKSGQLQLIEGVINPLPPRIAYEYHHHLPAALKQLDTMRLPADQLEPAQTKVKHKLQLQQLQIEIDYSLGLDFAYVAELVYEHADLLLFLRAGTTLQSSSSSKGDYGLRIVQHYEGFQQRMDDLLVHRFCYLSFLKQDEWNALPVVNQTLKDLPRIQKSLMVPTGIVLERHGLYRLSMVLRSLLPYRKSSTTELLMQYCDDLLWESQVLNPVSNELRAKDENLDETLYPPALFVNEERTANQTGSTISPNKEIIPEIASDLVNKELTRIQQQNNRPDLPLIPGWVSVDNRQLGPHRTTTPADILQLPHKPNVTTANPDRKIVTFVVPTSTRPNGIKNQYVTYSLNQLFPLIRRDFQEGGKLQANVLLVICGNTQDELDDHQNGLWEYYGPELQEGILEIVSTNLETYPSLHNIPNNYNDPENRLRWRSKQNLDISSSFFAAKGKSEYIMLLEDDTGYRDKFTSTLKALLESDERQEHALMPNHQTTGVGPFEDDYRQHIFAQVHFGFGYSGVLIHDEDVLTYATLHYVLMDEKPCDLLYLANYLQGQVLDQKWRWQLKRVLLTHLGSVSSLKGKFQPVWGIKG